jgi:hypothetical protein
MVREGQTFKFRGDSFVIKRVFTDTILALNLSSELFSMKRFAHLKRIK